MLSLKFIEVPQEQVVSKPVEIRDFECKDSVDTLLEKLANGWNSCLLYISVIFKLFSGCLSFNDLSLIANPEDEVQKTVGDIEEKKEQDVIPDERSETEQGIKGEPEAKIMKFSSDFTKLSKYEIIKKIMIHERLKRQNIQEDKVHVPRELKLNFEYYKLKNKLVRNTPVFQSIKLAYDKYTLEGAVDVARSARQGLISEEGGIPRVLTSEEKEKLLTLDNYENLSVPMRYCVLRRLMKIRKRRIKSSSVWNLQKIDKEYGVTEVEVYKLFKAVCCDLKNFIETNCKGTFDEKQFDEQIEELEVAEKMEVS